MRRFLFGVVIASVTAAMPAWALGGDREIAKAVMSELQQHKNDGKLKGFDIDLKVEEGVIYLDGKVASRAQRALVAKAASDTVGVSNLVNNLRVEGGEKPLPAPVKKQTVSKSNVVPATTGTSSRKSAQRQTPVQPAAGQQPVKTVSRQPAQPVAQPVSVDAKITDAIIARLQGLKNSGQLRGFELDVSTVNGDVWLRGKVANNGQKSLIMDAARRVRGVARVVDDVAVTNSSAIRPASTGALAPAQVAPTPIPQGSSMPVAGQPVPSAPQAFAPSGFAASMPQDVVAGRPVAMQGAGAQYGVSAPRYDQPNLPSYAWPSYAAYPNYGAVTYPKQYSPSAWPYIGPFYPYPQVPLGWRKVSLEWDDGLWYLDFTSK